MELWPPVWGRANPASMTRGQSIMQQMRTEARDIVCALLLLLLLPVLQPLAQSGGAGDGGGLAICTTLDADAAPANGGGAHGGMPHCLACGWITADVPATPVLAAVAAEFTSLPSTLAHADAAIAAPVIRLPPTRGPPCLV
jgi:hypothetical protein